MDSKTQLTKVILQELQNLGYEAAFSKLQKESDIKLENNLEHKLRQFVIMGQFENAIDLLDLNFNLEQLKVVENDRNKNFQKTYKFMIYQQKYLEMIEMRNSKEALEILRNQLTKYSNDEQFLHKLACLMMSRSLEDIQNHL